MTNIILTTAIKPLIDNIPINILPSSYINDLDITVKSNEPNSISEITLTTMQIEPIAILSKHNNLIINIDSEAIRNDLDSGFRITHININVNTLSIESQFDHHTLNNQVLTFNQDDKDDYYQSLAIKNTSQIEYIPNNQKYDINTTLTLC